MENEKRTFLDWIKDHKKELIIAGVSIAVIITAIIEIKNHKVMEKVWASLQKLVEKTSECIPDEKAKIVADVVPEKNTVEINTVTANRIPHDVSGHLRNLPEGWKASEEKRATAAEHEYELLSRQTWVGAYRTGELAA